MTNEEAIKMIKDDVRLHHDHLLGKYRKALSMAIEALSNSQKQSDSLIRTSADAVSEADVIYRADAIDAVKKNTFRLTFAEEQNCEGHVAWSAEAVYSDVMEGALMELPSAQPTLYGYPVEHLAMIARVLQKENFPPERIAEILSDVGLIVGMVRDEFEETLKETLKKVTERRSDETD